MRFGNLLDYEKAMMSDFGYLLYPTQSKNGGSTKQALAIYAKSHTIDRKRNARWYQHVKICHRSSSSNASMRETNNKYIPTLSIAAKPCLLS